MATIPTWQLQDAKNRFSELVDKTLDDGPQIVTKYGRPVVVVVSFDTYKALTRPGSLSEFLLLSPLAGAELNIERDHSLAREVDLG
ncbi:MAG TPA: type II toxin-antitoxin system Phd/YefM family antitoxin [Anaerolineales bacterium]|nr:type II toxin-antitoxin system Phd/YefM family antitoxin [Anaerolineales bacterium]